MIMPFNYLLEKYKISPSGIIHIGASEGQELNSYTTSGINRMIWVEAIPTVFEKLRKNLAPHPQAIAINACVSDVDGKEVNFNITNNDGQSSSMFNLHLHKEFHPEVEVRQVIKCTTQRLDSIIKNKNIDLNKYNFLNIDLQGSELLALKGLGQELHKIKYAYVEVNEKELYEGAPLVGEIDAYLAKFGFEGVEVEMTNTFWGDKFYINKNRSKAMDYIKWLRNKVINKLK